MAPIRWLVLLLAISCTVKCDDFDFKEQNKDDWVDPNDMINYDPITKTMRNKIQKSPDPTQSDNSNGAEKDGRLNDVPPNTKSDGKSPPPSECDCKNLKALNDSLVKCRKEMDRCPVLQEEPFFRQFIRSILERFKNCATHEVDDGQYNVKIKMSPSDYRYLSEYSERQQGTIQEVHSIFSRMMVDARWELHNAYEHKWFDKEVAVRYFGYATWIGCVLLAAAWYTHHLFRCLSSRGWFLIFLFEWFFISVAWTWWHLYKKEVAAGRTTMMSDMPKSCSSEGQSFWSLVYSHFTIGSDQCTKYFEHLEIDPFWTVTPTKALAVTLAEFILAPASYVGEAIKKLMLSAFEGLPLYLWLPVYALIILVIVLGLFVVFGYRLRTPLFNIEPHHPPPVQNVEPPRIQRGEPPRVQDVNSLKLSDVISTNYRLIINSRQSASDRSKMAPVATKSM